MKNDDNTIAIMGEAIEVERLRLPIDRLLFLPDNPRVYATIREMPDFQDLTSREKQSRIHEQLLEEASVKNLIPEIKRDKGLQEPIIVRYDTLEVIEGNSRLAVYRKLREDCPDEEHWAEISCLVVSKLTDEQQTRLLGQAHLHGKTDWSPYAKALFCFRWVVELKKSTAELARVSGISEAEINKSVKVIELMHENCDRTLSNFAYYDVLVRNKKIAQAIDDNLQRRDTRSHKPGDNHQLRDTLLAAIKSEQFTSRQMRDYLPTIIDKPNILRKFAQRAITLQEAHDRSKISDLQKKLKRIHEGLEDVEEQDVTKLEQNDLRSAEQLIKKIGRQQGRISDMVQKELTSRSENRVMERIHE